MYWGRWLVKAASRSSLLLQVHRTADRHSWSKVRWAVCECVLWTSEAIDPSDAYKVHSAVMLPVPRNIVAIGTAA